MIKEAIEKLVEGSDLSTSETEAVTNLIMEGGATQAQIGAVLIALRMKGETVDEITGAAKVMREKVTRINTSRRPLMDTCGTGGDRSHTFNISTAVALSLAGAGVTVAKHGNRSVSSRCGSADLLEALGVNINAPPQVVERCLDEVGMGFLFAPALHKAMKYAIGPRREMGVRTIFNILGPLTNPAYAEYQLLGVFDARWMLPLTQALRKLGVKAAMVVHGADGLDEITITDRTYVAHLTEDKGINEYEIDPEELGIKRCSLEELKGGDAEKNVNLTEGILKGEKGPHRDVVLLNSAAGLMIAGKVKDLKEGIGMAAESIDSGRARKVLEGLIKYSNME